MVHQKREVPLQSQMYKYFDLEKELANGQQTIVNEATIFFLDPMFHSNQLWPTGLGGRGVSFNTRLVSVGSELAETEDCVTVNCFCICEMMRL